MTPNSTPPVTTTAPRSWWQSKPAPWAMAGVVFILAGGGVWLAGEGTPRSGFSLSAGVLVSGVLAAGAWFATRRLAWLSTLVGQQGVAIQELQEATRRLMEEAEFARSAAAATAKQARATLDHMTDGFASVDAEWRYTFANLALADFVHQDRDAMLGKTVWSLFPEAVGSPVHAAYLRAMRERQAFDFETYYEPMGCWLELRFFPTEDGLSFFVRDVTARRRDEEKARATQADFTRLLAEAERSGQVLLSVIEDQKETEMALRESEDRYRSLVETSFEWVWEIDAEWRYTYASPRVQEMLGYAPEEVLGRTPFDFMPAAEAERVRTAFEKVAGAMAPFTGMENANQHRDGRIVVIETSGVPVLRSDGTLAGYRGVDRDITGRRMAERALHLRGAALEAAANAVMITDRAGRIEWVNSAFSELSGWARDEVIGRNPDDFLQSGRHGQAFYQQIRETVLAGRVWRGEIVNRRKDGVLRTEEMTVTPLRDPGGEVSHFIAIKQDITNQKEMEAHLLQTQRVEAIGTLAGGIAHDLNNILSPILLVSGVLRERLTNAEDREILEMAQSSAQRGADVVKQLLTFSRGQQGERDQLQPRHLIKEMVGIMRETFPREIQIHVQVPHELWTIIADPTQLHQVLLNLGVNARDAMPRGGSLTMAARNQHLEEGDAGLALGARPGPYVVIEVRDTGQGIAPEIRQRIFDPFFTTKPTGKGTGLGLSTVLGIVRSHDGFVQVDSTPGVGSTFRVCLPASAGAKEQTLPEPAAPALPVSAGQTILVVDDERSIRDATRILLERQNYRVVTAADGAEAVTLFRQERERISLVLTDLMMPVMDGVALIRALRSMQPELKIVATSGVTDGDQARDLAALGVPDILPKPADVMTLLATVHRRLTSN